MTDPIKHIEDANSQRDLGVFAARIYAGALEESGSRIRAFWILVAWFLAMFKAEQEPE